MRRVSAKLAMLSANISNAETLKTRIGLSGSFGGFGSGLEIERRWASTSLRPFSMAMFLMEG